MARYKMFIGGEWVESASNEHFESDNPFTGKPWTLIPRGNREDVDRAVQAARKALTSGEWPKLNASKRGALLRKLGDLIAEKSKALAEVEVRDNGKLYAEMSAQTAYMAQWYYYYGGLADKIEGHVIPTDKPDTFNYTRYEPVGVVAAIIPWNSPLLLLAWKLAPALAAGNVAVIKPSEVTSASSVEFARLFTEAGFPDGVVNVVTGFGAEAGAALVDHPDVAKIAFTGSDLAGEKIYIASAKHIKPVSLELGGKSPNIVFEDAEFEAAVMGVISGIFAATGQTCIAGSRLVLQRSIHDRFVKRLVEVAGRARIGNPMEKGTNVGPVA
ncbi:MAG: aldehyde dehydrogenase family protein, partial [Burkholderiales bacterium]|nr:aldehyde dehydrogenase family protein [Burkholderiales bacterium]